MSDINDGGQAFPVSDQFETVHGMTLRDWFAGQAEVPWNAVIETLKLKGNPAPTVVQLLAYRAELKYIEADAMIAARSKEPTKC